MKLPTKAPLVTALSLFLWLATSCGFFDNEKQRQLHIRSINTVLIADAAAARTSDGDYSLTAKKMRQIDISECPRDFSVAYIKHIHAWEEGARVQRARKQLKKQGLVAITTGLIAASLGIPFFEFDDILNADKELNALGQRASDNIRTTFNEVEILAVSYGGTLPPDN